MILILLLNIGLIQAKYLTKPTSKADVFYMLTNDAKLYALDIYQDTIHWVTDLKLTLNHFSQHDNMKNYSFIRPDMEGGYLYQMHGHKPVRVSREQIGKVLNLCPYFSRQRLIEYQKSHLFIVDSFGQSQPLDRLQRVPSENDLIVAIDSKTIQIFDPQTYQQTWCIISSQVQLRYFKDFISNNDLTTRHHPVWSFETPNFHSLIIKNGLNGSQTKELSTGQSFVGVYAVQNKTIYKLRINSPETQTFESKPTGLQPYNERIKHYSPQDIEEMLLCLDDQFPKIKQLPPSEIEYVSRIDSKLFLALMGLALGLLGLSLYCLNKEYDKLKESFMIMQSQIASEKDRSKGSPLYSISQQVISKAQSKCKVYKANLMGMACAAKEINFSPQLEARIQSLKRIQDPVCGKIILLDKQRQLLFSELGSPDNDSLYKKQKEGRLLVVLQENCKSLFLQLIKLVKQLHHAKIVGLNIKPSNLIFIHGSPKMIDLFKEDSHSSQKDDIRDLGYLFWHVATKGRVYRQSSVQMRRRARQQNVFLYDLIRRMTEEDERLMWQMEQIQRHPFFWKKLEWTSCLQNFSNKIQTIKLRDVWKRFDKFAIKQELFRQSWEEKLDPRLVQEVNSFRAYDSSSAKDLVRVIRNKLNHFYELPEQIKQIMGGSSEGVLEYFCRRFKRLQWVVYRFQVDVLREF